MNNKVGIIGFGSMGSMIFKGFLRSGLIDPDDLKIATRSREKAEKYRKHLCSDNRELVRDCGTIILCVKPLEMKLLLEEVKSELTPDKHLVTIAASVTTDHIYQYYPLNVTRVLPAVLSEIDEGVTLIAHHLKADTAKTERMNRLFQSIGKIRITREEDFETLSDITSCGPGLLAGIFREYVNAVCRHTDLDKSEICEIMNKVVMGTARLAGENNLSYDQLIDRVATRGGVTEAGVKVLEQYLPDVLDSMVNKTLEIQTNRRLKIDGQFNEKETI